MLYVLRENKTETERDCAPVAFALRRRMHLVTAHTKNGGA